MKTLYINNLNERIPQKILNAELVKLFSEYGALKHVRTGRGIRKRGQAFIQFESDENAERAMNALQSTQLFKKPICITFAKTEYGIKPKKEKLDNVKPDTPTEPVAAKSPEASETSDASFGEPHNILLLQSIPDSITPPQLEAKCAQFAGFVEARMFAVKHVGFIDFEDIKTAEAAIGQIARMGLGNVAYAKK